MSSNLKRFVKDASWAFASLAIAAGVQFILRIFLARYFGAGDLGLYTLAFTFYSFGLIFSGFGIDGGVRKYVAENVDDSNRVNILMKSGIFLSFFTGCIMGFILFIASPYISNYFFKMPELTILLRIVSCTFPFIAVEKTTLGFLNGLRRMKLFALINIFQNILVIALTLAFALAGFDLKYAVISLALPVVLMSILSLLLVRRSLSWLKIIESSGAIKTLVAFGFYVVLANSMGTLQIYVDSTMIGYFMTNVDVGIFAVAKTIIPALLMPSQAVQSITTPIIAGHWGKNEIESIGNLINRSMKYAAFYAILIAFVIGFLSQDLIKLLFGQDFISASLPLQILLVGSVASAILSPIGGALSSTAYVKIIFMLSGITVILNIILNILLIPHFGITGAAVASSICMVLGTLIQLYAIHRLLEIKIEWAWFVKLFSFALPLAMGTYFLGRIVSIYISLALALSILLFVMFKYFFNREDRKQLKILIRRPNM